MIIARDGNDTDNSQHTNHNKRDDGHHFDAGKPEFRLGKGTHRQCVQGKISTMNNALHAHAGEFGNHFCMISPDAVNSEPKAPIQARK